MLKRKIETVFFKKNVQKDGQETLVVSGNWHEIVQKTTEFLNEKDSKLKLVFKEERNKIEIETKVETKKFKGIFQMTKIDEGLCQLSLKIKEKESNLKYNTTISIVIKNNHKVLYIEDGEGSQNIKPITLSSEELINRVLSAYFFGIFDVSKGNLFEKCCDFFGNEIGENLEDYIVESLQNITHKIEIIEKDISNFYLYEKIEKGYATYSFELFRFVKFKNNGNQNTYITNEEDSILNRVFIKTNIEQIKYGMFDMFKYQPSDFKTQKSFNDLIKREICNEEKVSDQERFSQLAIILLIWRELNYQTLTKIQVETLEVENIISSFAFEKTKMFVREFLGHGNIIDILMNVEELNKKIKEKRKRNHFFFGEK